MNLSIKKVKLKQSLFCKIKKMDWINCSSCFNQPGNGIKFHLTSCGHIFCEVCIVESKNKSFLDLTLKLKENLYLQPGIKDCCFICNQKCTNFQLTNQVVKIKKLINFILSTLINFS